jgi:hypothetical protein
MEENSKKDDSKEIKRPGGTTQEGAPCLAHGDGQVECFVGDLLRWGWEELSDSRKKVERAKIVRKQLRELYEERHRVKVGTGLEGRGARKSVPVWRRNSSG